MTLAAAYEYPGALLTGRLWWWIPPTMQKQCKRPSTRLAHKGDGGACGPQNCHTNLALPKRSAWLEAKDHESQVMIKLYNI